MRFRSKWTVFAIVILIVITALLEKWTRPEFSQSGSVKIWDRRHTLLYQSAGEAGSHIAVKYEDFPEHLINATIASEDKNFYRNPGFDTTASLRALYQNIISGRIVSGASTITQQLARIGVISPYSIHERSYVKKIREILIAARINASMTKKEIITEYLNRVYFGNLSYGAEAAARTYFDKSAKELSLAESALLTSLIASPENRNPYTNIAEAKKQQKRVLAAMTKLKMIGETQAREAEKEDLAFNSPKTGIKAPHFVHFILSEFKAMDISEPDVNIETTLDYYSYERSQSIASQWINRLRNNHNVSNAAVVLLKNDTGEILAMLGGIDYFDASRSGQINLAIAKRQPGSALKPFAYAAAFAKNYTPATAIYDVKKIYKTKKNESYSPNNYDGKFHGPILAREALASSMNLPAVETLNRIGIHAFIRTLNSAGIYSLSDPEKYDLSVVLGGGEVTLLELTNAYAGLGRGGIYRPAYAIEKITDSRGKTLYKNLSANARPIFGDRSSQIAYLISDILSDPKARIPAFGEKNPLILSRPAAVKTGTTTDWHDNWTVGYTPSYTVGVWVGNNNNQAMRSITGVVGAAPIWNQFFEDFLRDKPREEFRRPEGIKTMQICKTDGLIAGELCGVKIFEKFIAGTEPKKISSIHKKIRIDKRNGLLAVNCPEKFTEESVLIDYPAEVYSWAEANNQPVIPRENSPLCTDIKNDMGKGYIEIIYPKDRAIFKLPPRTIPNRAIVFEASVGSPIVSVNWKINGIKIGTVNNPPYSLSWVPEKGSYSITAEGRTNTGQIFTAPGVTIVVEEE